jgi:hypothetical protein
MSDVQQAPTQLPVPDLESGGEAIDVSNQTQETKQSKKKRTTVLLIGILVGIAVIGVGVCIFLLSTTASTSTTQSQTMGDFDLQSLGNNSTGQTEIVANPLGESNGHAPHFVHADYNLDLDQESSNKTGTEGFGLQSLGNNSTGQTEIIANPLGESHGHTLNFDQGDYNLDPNQESPDKTGMEDDPPQLWSPADSDIAHTNDNKGMVENSSGLLVIAADVPP